MMAIPREVSYVSKSWVNSCNPNAECGREGCQKKGETRVACRAVLSSPSGSANDRIEISWLTFVTIVLVDSLRYACD